MKETRAVPTPSYSKGQEIRTIRTPNIFSVEGSKKGGMGEVFFARRKKDQKLYALKTIQAWGKRIEEGLMRHVASFRRESLVWVTLGKHKNIVQAFWFDLDEQYRPFLIMEYVEGDPSYGVSLWHWLPGGKGLEPSLALRFALETLNGLIYAKKIINGELGKVFIHRDIKPENLLIARDGTLKVSDFGLVMSGGGSPPYMAPEQWMGKEVEEKTDVYDLACVLYEMIKGKPPFEVIRKTREEARKEYKHKHINELPKPIKATPGPLNNLILRCLDKSPPERLDFVDFRKSLQDVYSSISGRSFDAVDEPEPLSAEEYNARGSAFDELGYFDKALNCYDAAIALDPNDVRFYLNRANARLALKDFDGSWEDYELALKLEPQAVEAYLGLGIMMVQKGENERALEYYHQAEKVNSQEPMVYVGLGNLYAKNGKYPEAETAFMKALSLRAGTAEAYLGLGNVSVCRQDYKNAEKYYKKAICLNPLYSQAYFSLAQLYHWWDREDDMNDTLKTLKEIEPGIGQISISPLGRG